MKTWDVAVVGAGPAGSVAACLLARRGLDVLLLDQARFPRAKACGGCLNRSTLARLAAAGSDRRTVAWATEHHRPESAWSVPTAVGRVLKDADDD